MLRYLIALTLLMLPNFALAYEPIKEKGSFLEVLKGRDLHIGIYGLTLTVSEEGEIIGRALGSPITGSWAWRDGYFCRELDWSGREIPYNCQLVEVNGSKLRFTTDKGMGDSAAFNLR